MTDADDFRNDFREIARRRAEKDAAALGRRVDRIPLPGDGNVVPLPLDANTRRRYALSALRREADTVSRAAEGTRNDRLNTAAFNLASLVDAGELAEDNVVDLLTTVAVGAGLTHAETVATIRSGFEASRSKVGARELPDSTKQPATEYSTPNGIIVNGDAGAAAIDHARRVVLTPVTDILDDVPTWAWEYGGKGRIQRGTLALFAGRPGAGKSSAARWFAAQASRGLLDGCWAGEPQRVAYIAPAEESLQYIVKPGLRGAEADIARIDFVSVHQGGDEVRLLSSLDEDMLTATFVEAGVSIVIVDPLMSTIGANVDIHRNNETRAYVEPWARLADRIGGVVLGVVHLRKDTAGDPVAAINGSSAFGEVARAVFGFAKDPQSDDGDRVMSQAKNSAGHEDLALTYRIETTVVTTDAGKQAEVGMFAITGESDVTVGEVMNSDGAHGGEALKEALHWLEDYLTEAGREPSSSVKNAARKIGISETTLKRASRKLRVVSESVGFPRVTVWSLPVIQSGQSGQA